MIECTCGAQCADDCVCGGWDDVDATESYQFDDYVAEDGFSVEEDNYDAGC